MTGIFDNFLPAMAMISLAMAFFHRAIPGVIYCEGREAAIKVWLLAMALALIGSGRFMMFLYGHHGPWISTFGIYCLIGHAVMRWRKAKNCGLRKWWE